MAISTLTCHTAGCENEGIPIPMDLNYVDDAGEPQTMTAICGPCGSPITDLRDATS